MKRSLLLLAPLGMLAAACGGGTASAPDVDTTPTSPPTTEAPAPETTEPPPETTTTEPGPTAAASLQEVKGAVVRIVGTGTFVDPAEGIQANVPGSGSGFVIDPSGIAVTNNHVVTGAGLLDVYVDGEDDPRNARVLGVSECSDLAVIDIGGPEFEQYLDWFDGTVETGMPIFAAGFPLGDSEYTVLDGIISKEDADGETSWASVDSVIEHSADTLPGNSGGPIVTDDGKVVAVNYAGNAAGQSFAIGIGVARPIVDELASGVDIDSIGINGEALTDGTNSGIWVASVQSGSPADESGIEPGDLLLSMESVTLATDGTMADYCDILRSHEPTDTLDIELYRSSADAILAGQLNGRPLEIITSFAAQLDEEVADDAGGFTYTDYVTVTDESSLISLSVPAEWSDVDGRQWSSTLVPGQEIIGPALTAAPDLTAYRETWGTPGVFIGASALITESVEELLNKFDFSSDCTLEGRFDYDDGVYTGLYDIYTACGAEGSTFIQVVAEPADSSWIASVQIVVVTDADLDAADEIFRTFVVQPLGG